MKRKIEPTEYDIRVLRVLSESWGAILEQSEYPKKTYFLVAEDGTRLGMYTMAEVTRWWKAGWIVCRQDADTHPKNSGEYIVTDAGSEIVDAAPRPDKPAPSLIQSRYET